MAAVVVGLAAVAIVALSALALTLAVARRLRLIAEHGLADGGGWTAPGLGLTIDRFSAQTVDGQTLSDSSFAKGSALVAFVSTECTACVNLKRELVNAGPRDNLFVFIFSGQEEPIQAVVDDMARVARVVWAGVDETLRSAFYVDGFPTVLRVTNGVIARGGIHLRDVMA